MHWDNSSLLLLSVHLMQGILFDFFGTLVTYSTSRVEQGYQQTHQLLVESGIDVHTTPFLRSGYNLTSSGTNTLRRRAESTR